MSKLNRFAKKKVRNSFNEWKQKNLKKTVINPKDMVTKYHGTNR